MGFLDRLFRRHTASLPDPAALREQLFDAVTDQARFEALCLSHKELILQHFGEWTKVPEALRSEDQEVQRWGQGVLATAQFFASQGHSELLQRLTRSPAENPLLRIEERLARVFELIDQHKFSEAIPVLTSCPDELEKCKGPGKDHLLAVIHGRLGQCLFHSGSPQQAVPHVKQALALCQESMREDDRESVATYLELLYEIHRYLGETREAALLAERLGQEAATEKEREQWQRQAQRVRSGEPPNRVIVRVGEQTFEIDEVPRIEEKAQFLFVRNRIDLLLANDYLERGFQHGAQGDHEQALACFEEAARIDPFIPDAPYLAGLSLLFLRRYAEAVASYEKTEALAPGWLHCRADLAMARGLHANQLSHESFLATVRIDQEKLAEERLRIATAAVSLAPGLAELHLQRGRVLVELKRTADAKAAFEQGLAVGDNVDVRTRLLVELANCTSPSVERTRFLHEAIELSGNLGAAAAAQVMLRSPATSA